MYYLRLVTSHGGNDIIAENIPDVESAVKALADARRVYFSSKGDVNYTDLFATYSNGHESARLSIEQGA